MRKTIASILSVTIALAGCATASKDVATSYVSPMQYQSFDCEQLASETQRVAARVNQLGGRLDQAASNDKTIGVVGAILFWPALFALGGTKEQEAEYARLKGEYDAIQQSAIVKKCPGAAAAQVQAEKATTPNSADGDTKVASTPQQGNEEKLKELKRLFEAGLVSSEVYAAQQKVILGKH
jgi:hypothetical protein